MHSTILASSDHRTVTRPTARAITIGACALACSADLLLYQDPVGLGFTIWIGLLVLVVIAVIWRDARTVPRESATWLAVALFFASGVAWRASGALRALDVLATAGALGLAAVTLRRSASGLFARRATETLWTAAAVLRSIAAGVVPLVLRGALGARLRPALLALVMLVVFGSLLRGADPIFASFVSLRKFDVNVVVSHVLVIGAFFWLAAGWMRGAVLPPPLLRESESLPFALQAADVTAVLGTLTALFVLFVIAQLGWFFGGETFLRARTGLTAAAYARSGFFQLVWVVTLAVPVLLGTRVALAPGRALARRHTMLSLPVVALLTVMLVSAALRMRLYVYYYGLTLERLYSLAFLAWLAIVLAWMTVTVLRSWSRPFVAGATVSALVTLGALNVMNPDALVARVNVARGAGSILDASTKTWSNTAPLDLAHLATLGGDAAAIVVPAVIAAPASDPQRCTAARELLHRWGPNGNLRTRGSRAASWRWWNAGEDAALGVMLSSDAALRAAMHANCVPAGASGQR